MLLVCFCLCLNMAVNSYRTFHAIEDLAMAVFAKYYRLVRRK